MKRLLTILIILLYVHNAFAYPISPQTLRKLIANSQYIVIALVDNPETGGKKFFDPKTKDTLEYFTFGGDGLADLYIKEVLKGKPDNLEHIMVSYEAGMICPAPPDYPDKKMVIAFLGKEDTSKTYYTIGLSYGSKIMENDIEINAFKTRILEYIEILKINNKRNRELATIEWLVKCAENKYTRWEGAYELSRKGDFMSYYDYSKDEQFHKELSKSQLQRLDSVFFATDTISYKEMCLSNLISKDNYPKLKKHLLKNLPHSHYYMVTDIMKKIIEISPNDELMKIVTEVEDISYDDKEREYIQKLLVDKFVAIASSQ